MSKFQIHPPGCETLGGEKDPAALQEHPSVYLTFPTPATRPNLWEGVDRGGKGRKAIKIQRNNFALEFKWVDL